MKTAKIFIFMISLMCISLLIIFSSFALANELVDVKIDRDIATIGDRLEYTIFLKIPEQYKVISDINFPDTKNLVLIDEAILTGKKNVFKKQFIFTSFTVSSYLIKGPKITIQHKNGTEKTIIAKDLQITFKSIAKTDEKFKDIKDIVDIKNYPTNYNGILIFSALLLIFICFFIIGIKVILKKIVAKNVLLQEKLPLRSETTQDEAINMLNAIGDSRYIEQNQSSVFCEQIADVLKKFFDTSFDIQTADKTTSEILRMLSISSVSAETKNEIKKVLTQCDMVKFAKVSPETDELNRCLEISKNIITKIGMSNNSNE